MLPTQAPSLATPLMRFIHVPHESNYTHGFPVYTSVKGTKSPVAGVCVGEDDFVALALRYLIPPEVTCKRVPY